MISVSVPPVQKLSVFMTNTMMRSHHGYGHRHLLVQSSSILFFLGTLAAAQAASDILTKGSNLTDGETLVSANGSFTLGFFSTRGMPERRYLGIWFTVSNSSTDAVCWVANRDRPLGDTSGVLAISDTGNLLLVDGSGRTAWSSNTTAGAASLTVKLLESGNIVLFDGNGEGREDDVVVKLWQSFDHPTNTLLPGAKIGINLWSGGGWSLTSWRSPDDPSSGDLRYVMVRRGGLLPEIMMLDSSDAIRYRTGVWNGRWFSGVPEMYYSYSDRFVFQVTVSPSEVSFSYTAKPGAPSLSRVVLNGSTGKAERAMWEPDKHGWVDYFQGPRDDCDDYNMCGHSGVCNQTAASTAWPCSCIQGFVPVSPSDWDRRYASGGCRRNMSLDCSDDNGTTTDWFVRLAGVKLPDTLNSSLDTSVVTMDECRARCLANCSCVAYAAADMRGGGDGTGCIMWPENLTDLRYVDGGQTLYLRQARPAFGMNFSEIHVSRKTKTIYIWNRESA